MQAGTLVGSDSHSRPSITFSCTFSIRPWHCLAGGRHIVAMDRALGVLVVAHIVRGVAVRANGRFRQPALVETLAVDRERVVRQHAVLRHLGVLPDGVAFLVAATAHERDVEAVDARIRIRRRRDVVRPVAGPAARRDGHARGDADTVQAPGVLRRHGVVAGAAIDDGQILRVGPVLDAGQRRRGSRRNRSPRVRGSSAGTWPDPRTAT